jgi:hypothetical protein
MFECCWQGTNEILRLFVALQGMQHAGKQLKELVKYVCMWTFTRFIAEQTTAAKKKRKELQWIDLEYLIVAVKSLLLSESA